MASSPEPAAVPDPMRPVPCRIVKLARETPDTFTLALAPPEAGGFCFAAGQFNMLYAFGVGEVPISISGDPAQADRIVHTIRAVGATTQALRRLRPGDWVGVRGPFGSAWPVELAHGHDVVIVAGGIGLAPLRPALYHVLAHRALYGRVLLLYGARSPAELLYARELQRWRGRFDAAVAVTVDRASGEWQGAVGVVTKLIARASFDAASAVALLCGPEIMLRFSVDGLLERGVPEANIFVSLERNMKCGIGLCGHCQLGPSFVCKDGPVFRYDAVESLLRVREA